MDEHKYPPNGTTPDYSIEQTISDGELLNCKPDHIVRAHLMVRYAEEFKEPVDRLRSEIEVFDSSQQHPALLGRGTFSKVFAIEAHQKLYALRLIELDNDDMTIEGYVGPLISAVGVPGVEQIVAYSEDDGVTVSEIVPGRLVALGATLNEIQNITPNQVAGLIITVSSLYNRGLRIDDQGYNTFYDPDTGFHVIDFSGAEPGSEPSEFELGWILATTIRDTVNCLVMSKYSHSDKPHSGRLKTEYLEAGIELISKFKEQVEEKLEYQDARRTVLRDMESLKYFYLNKIEQNNSDGKFY
jgi:hypothetical protein